MQLQRDVSVMLAASALGSSDFPRSHCFMWFWFGLEILRLVYKKAFFKYWAVSILFDLLTSQKNSTIPHKSWKKISSKLDAKGIKRSGILRWFQNYVELLHQEVPKYFFSEKRLFPNFHKSLKIQFFCKIFFPFCQYSRLLHIFEMGAKFRFFWYPLHPISKNFFFNSYKGRCYFFWRIKGQIR